MKVHELPSCIPYTAIYYPYIDRIKQMGQVLDKIVFYEKKGVLEGGMLGITYNCQISKDYFIEPPKIGDLIEIEEKQYKIISVQTKNQTIMIETYYQLELKLAI